MIIAAFIIGIVEAVLRDVVAIFLIEVDRCFERLAASYRSVRIVEGVVIRPGIAVEYRIDRKSIFAISENDIGHKLIGIELCALRIGGKWSGLQFERSICAFIVFLRIPFLAQIIYASS